MRISKRESTQRIICGIARELDFAKLSLDDVLAIKSDSDVTHYRFVENETKVAQEGEHQYVDHHASLESVDSMGDVIVQAGWDLRRVTSKNSRLPLLYGHDANPLPMGLVVSANKHGKHADSTPALVTRSRFHNDDVFQDSEWGKHVKGVKLLVARKELNGSSVGFAPIDADFPDQEEREKRGMPAYGVKFLAQELVELSITPVPAHSGANQKDFASALHSLVAAGELSESEAGELRDMLKLNEKAWLARISKIGKAVVPVNGTRDTAALMKEFVPAVVRYSTDPGGIVLGKTATEESAQLTLSSESLTALSLALVPIVREAVSRVIREHQEAFETAIIDATDLLDEARGLVELSLKTATSERAERATAASVTAPAIEAPSTGKTRAEPEEPNAVDLKAIFLRSALAAVPSGRGSDDRTSSARRQSGDEDSRGADR